MDMDAYKVQEIIRCSQRFISPFREPCSYFIWKEDDKTIGTMEMEIYWEKLKYMAENAEQLIQQAFQPAFYDFYGVHHKKITSPDAMCRKLMVESFVLLIDKKKTVSFFLSNEQFMFGHYIECLWDDHWKFLYSYIC